MTKNEAKLFLLDLTIVKHVVTHRKGDRCMDEAFDQTTE